MFLNAYHEGIVKNYLNRNGSFRKSIKKMTDIRGGLKNNGFFVPFLVLGNAFNNLTLEDSILDFKLKDLVIPAMEELKKHDNYIDIAIPAYISSNTFDTELNFKYENFYKRNYYYLNIYRERYGLDVDIKCFNNYLVLYSIVENLEFAKKLYGLVSMYQDFLYLEALDDRLNKSYTRIDNIDKEFNDSNCSISNLLSEIDAVTSIINTKLDSKKNILKSKLLLDR